MTGKLTSVGIQCGSNPGLKPAYMLAAADLGKALAAAGVRAVYGGVRTGLMGALADSVIAHGGCVVGVLPKFMAEDGIAHDGLSELSIVATMNERKCRMVEMSDATIVLPGGVGTQDEFWECLVGAQLGFHAKPCGILNVEGYYDPLLAFIDRAHAEGFLSGNDKRNVVVGNDAEALIAELSRRVM